MAVRMVRIFGDPVLRTKAQPVTSFDGELRQLIADMFETMTAYDGAGLAAVQVGVPLRVFVVDVPQDDGTRARHVIANPELSDRSGEETAEEGCLSIPGIYEDVTRSAHVMVRGQDEHGKPVSVEASGFLARAMQHETDHLDGVLFVDRLSPLKRQFLKRQLAALARGEVPEGHHPEPPRPDPR
jgi:peptide deformylase